jgi:hypothetical protein
MTVTTARKSRQEGHIFRTLPSLPNLSGGGSVRVVSAGGTKKDGKRGGLGWGLLTD